MGRTARAVPGVHRLIAAVQGRQVVPPAALSTHSTGRTREGGSWSGMEVEILPGCPDEGLFKSRHSCIAVFRLTRKRDILVIMELERVMSFTSDCPFPHQVTAVHYSFHFFSSLPLQFLFLSVAPLLLAFAPRAGHTRPLPPFCVGGGRSDRMPPATFIGNNNNLASQIVYVVP